MDIDRFAQLKSPVHAWDPRFKIISLIIFIGVIACLKGPGSLLLVLLLAAGMILLSRLPLNFVLRALKIPAVFLIIMVPILMLTAGGRSLYEWGPFRIYEQGVQTGGIITLRAMSIMLVFITLFSTARLHITMHALQLLRLPRKLVHLFLFTYRYIFLYFDELQRLRQAVRLRGFTRTGALLRFKAVAGLIVNLLIHGLEHSERISAAMRLLGFDGEYMIRMPFHASWKDGVKSAAVMCACVLLLVWDIL